MNRRSFFSLLRSAPLAAAVTPVPKPTTSRVTSCGGWLCECGLGLWHNDKTPDQPNTMKCLNGHCRHFDKDVRIPSFEAQYK